MTFKTSDLKILCSIRVRLNSEERKLLKDAYRSRQSQDQPANRPLVNRGSSISVQHAPTHTDINQRLGLPHIVVIDILSSREAISLPTLLLFQRELGIEIVSEDELTQAFTGYLDHVKTTVVPSMGN